MAKKQTSFSVTRRQIVDAARSFLGWKYRHQARGEDDSVDCVGLLVLLGQKLKIPDIQDLPDYRRVPSATVLLDYLKRNLKEISLRSVHEGDIVLMKMGGLKPRHTAIITNTATDLEKGIEPTMIHALSNGAIQRVVEQPIGFYAEGFTNGFRIKLLKD